VISLHLERRRERGRRIVLKDSAAMRVFKLLASSFADDVIRVLREATLEELMQLLGPPPAKRRAAGRAAVRPARRARPAVRRPAPTSPEVAPAQEITDPSALLAAIAPAEVPSPPSPPLTPEAVAAEPRRAPPPPESETRPTREVVVQLRANETLARASGAGVVIRRKRA
jgi:hypothetical protein